MNGQLARFVGSLHLVRRRFHDLKRRILGGTVLTIAGFHSEYEQKQNHRS